MNKTVSVGTESFSKKSVTPLNAEIFKGMKAAMEEATNEPTSCWHIGWHSLGEAVDWLEKN